MSDNKIWFITGCSTGFGRSLTEELLKTNHRVVATARDPKTLDDLLKKYPDQLLTLALDVTKKNDIERAVKSAVDKFSRIDVLVNNAGYGIVGAVEEASVEDIKRIFNTNVFGLIEMTKSVLPVMRKQKSGNILNISSVAGFASLPGFGIYNSTKYAVEGMSEALYSEVSPFGIKVTIIEPGPFRTDFANRSLARTGEMSEYDDVLKTMRQYTNNIDGKQPGDPVRGAKAMMELVAMTNPPLRIPFGQMAVDRIQLKINNFTKDMKTFEKLIKETDFPN
ncbi:MAG: SDR family NAD(P)-dependent oxidoreductase [Bacteriovorax sp.]|nr:SDR family NAD(P)-dependent oxidoreductase [Bacteriovorax sp.]